MKKISIFLVSILLALSLCSYISDNTTYTVDKYGTSFEVDTKNGTISDGENTYHYLFSGNSASYEIEIIYPNGSTYWEQMQKNSGGGSSGTGGHSDDYVADQYVAGEILCDIISEKVPKESDPIKFFIIILLLITGIFTVAFPYAAWYLQCGWRYKDAEPSEMILWLNRVSGIIAIIAGIVMIFIY